MAFITFTCPGINKSLPYENYITVNGSERGHVAPYFIYRASGKCKIRVYSPVIETVEFEYDFGSDDKLKLDIELALDDNYNIVDVGYSVYKVARDSLAAYMMSARKLKGGSAPSSGSTSSSSSTSGGCYVATCLYGSYDCPQVWTLRRYRDNTLAKSVLGRSFIRTYYAVSPTIVKWFGSAAWFKKLWQGKLDRLVARLQAKGVEDTPYSDRCW